MERLGKLWWAVLPAWLWALLLLWAASGGVICMLEGIGLLLAGGPVALAWLLTLPACIEARKGRALRQWLSVPVVWVAAILLATTDLPMLARFGLSEPALRHYAERGDLGTSRDENAKCVGLFHVNEVWRHGRTVAFVTDTNIFDRYGLIYAPDGLPTDLPMEVEQLLGAQSTHIYGPWYKFEM